MRAGAATVTDLAAYLGVTPRRVRQVIAEHHIEPVGQRWKAGLYDPHVVFRHAGAHHRGDTRSTLPLRT